MQSGIFLALALNGEDMGTVPMSSFHPQGPSASVIPDRSTLNTIVTRNVPMR